MTDIVYNKNGVPFDIDAIATDVNGKADRDLLNVSDTGNIQMANASMPSNIYTKLTVGASGSTYTAPADGYFYACMGASGNGSINMYSSAVGVYYPYIPNGNAAKAYIPIRKGGPLTLAYTNANWTSESYLGLWFVYAIGSESEAQ